MIVPFAAGGTVDIVARIVGAKLSDIAGSRVVVDNRGGAGGVIGTEMAARSPGDGYTLLMHSASITYDPSLHDKLPYDTMKDLAPVAMIGTTPNLLVVAPSFPARSVTDLIPMGREKPGSIDVRDRRIRQLIASRRRAVQLSVGRQVQPRALQGRGTGARRRRGRPRRLHGRDDAGRDPAGPGGSAARAGHIEPDALARAARCADHRGSGLPGYEYVAWFGVFAPGTTPPVLVARINAFCGKPSMHPTRASGCASKASRRNFCCPTNFAKR